jgi:hypothetical protein
MAPFLVTLRMVPLALLSMMAREMFLVLLSMMGLLVHRYFILAHGEPLANCLNQNVLNPLHILVFIAL